MGSQEQFMNRSSILINNIGELTPEEKLRLGWLIYWAIDGPEQGFFNNHGIALLRKELHEFLDKNGIKGSRGQMWLYDESILGDTDSGHS